MPISENLTVIIKTFERPRHLDRAIQSIKKYYPELRILVADDSKTPIVREDVEYYVLPYDSGLSYGRNFLLDKVQTKYTLLFDDDHIVTESTQLEKMIRILEENPIDLVAGDLIEQGGRALRFHGVFKQRWGILFLYLGRSKSSLNGYLLYEIVLNFFVARTDKLKEIRWDDSIKFHREHVDFFLRARGKLKITRLHDFSVEHFSIIKQHGGLRGAPFVKRFLAKWKLFTWVRIEEWEKGGGWEVKRALKLYLNYLMRRFRTINVLRRKVWFWRLSRVKKQFVFILCSQRSGSTPLKELLGLADDLTRFPDIRLREMSDALFAAKQKEKIILIKYPNPRQRNFYQDYFETWFQLKAKFIVLYRHPFFVMRSIRKMIELVPDEEETGEEEIINYWCETYETILNRMREEDRDSWIFVSYVELCGNPKEVTRRLFRFVGSSCKEAFDSYKKPQNYQWCWGNGDNSMKLWTMKVQEVDENERNWKDLPYRMSDRAEKIWETLNRLSEETAVRSL